MPITIIAALASLTALVWVVFFSKVPLGYKILAGLLGLGMVLPGLAGLIARAAFALTIFVILVQKAHDSHRVYLACLGTATILALLVDSFYPSRAGGWRPIFLYSFVALAASIGIVGLMEYVLLRFIGMWRLGALVRVTYYEILLQPFTQN